jgi:hypothetical protein
MLTRLQKLKVKLENLNSSDKQPEIDTYTQQIIDSAALNSNITSINNTDLDDIFYDDPEDDEDEEEVVDDTME